MSLIMDQVAESVESDIHLKHSLPHQLHLTAFTDVEDGEEDDDVEEEEDDVHATSQEKRTPLSVTSPLRVRINAPVTEAELKNQAKESSPSRRYEAVKAEIPMKCGYLKKKGVKRKRWKKRWFVLRPTKLTYYQNDKEYELLAILELDQIHSIVPVELKKRQYVFGIVTKQRTFYMQATSELDMYKWIYCIRAMMKDGALIASGEMQPNIEAMEAAIQEHGSTPLSPLSASVKNKTIGNGLPIDDMASQSSKLESLLTVASSPGPSISQPPVHPTATTETHVPLLPSVPVIIPPPSLSTPSCIHTDHLVPTALSPLSPSPISSSALRQTPLSASWPGPTQDFSPSTSTSASPQISRQASVNHPSPLSLNTSLRQSSPLVGSPLAQEDGSSSSEGEDEDDEDQSPIQPTTTAAVLPEETCSLNSTEFKANVARHAAQQKSDRLKNLDVGEDGVFTDDRIVFQGYLQKQGTNYKKKWKKRWLVLRQNTLTTYKDDKEYVVGRLIQLKQVLDIIPIDPQGKTHHFCLKVVLPKHSLVLCAETIESRDVWIKNMKTQHGQVWQNDGNDLFANSIKQMTLDGSPHSLTSPVEKRKSVLKSPQLSPIEASPLIPDI